MEHNIGTSIFWKLLLSFKENSTSTSKDKTSMENAQHAWRELKLLENREKERKAQHITRTNETIENPETKKHTRRIRPSHSR